VISMLHLVKPVYVLAFVLHTTTLDISVTQIQPTQVACEAELKRLHERFPVSIAEMMAGAIISVEACNKATPAPVKKTKGEFQ
jgi:hypothetical protein